MSSLTVLPFVDRRLILDNALRLQYLEAMGIDVWLPRASVHSEQPAIV